MDRFYQKIDTAHETDCHIWIGYRNPAGYGVFIVDRKPVGAHRMAWRLANGPIPDGMLVCHRCDNPSCVNPDHLFLGTQLDNMRDMVKKKRAKPQPKQHGKAFMQPSDYVTRLASIDLTPYAAAGELGVSIRQSLRYASGTTPIPFTVAKLVRAMVAIKNKS